jgi:hypothetical protein
VVQLDVAVTQILPDSEADVSGGGRQKRVLKFGSVRVPGLEGFEELKGTWRSWWDYRDRNGRYVINGMYLLEIKAGATIIKQKIIVTR